MICLLKLAAPPLRFPQMNNWPQQVRNDISQHGYHFIHVFGGGVPDYYYTIGNSESIGVELCVAGASFYSSDELLEVIKIATQEIRSFPFGTQLQMSFSLPEVTGQMSLGVTHRSWLREIGLKAVEWYKPKKITMLQILPPADVRFIDHPDLSKEFDPEAQSAWRWISQPWKQPWSIDSQAQVDIAVLRGSVVKEVIRWSDTSYAMVSKEYDSIESEDLREIPVSIVFAHDDSIGSCLKGLEVGHGMCRQSKEDEWEYLR